MLVHDGGFDVCRTLRGGFRFYDPNGKLIPQAPRQPRGHCVEVVGPNLSRGLRPDGMTLYPRFPSPPSTDLRWSTDALLFSRAGP